jgi:hypothetical protein
MTQENASTIEPEVKQSRWKTVKRMAVIIVGLFLLVALVESGIGLITGWKSGVQYSNAFFISGAILATIGLLSVLGNYRARSTFGIQYSQSSGDMALAERTKLWLADVTQGYNALIVLALSGALLIGLSVLVAKWFVQ